MSSSSACTATSLSGNDKTIARSNLFSIFSSLDIRNPLPEMREWAMSPDLAKLVIALVQERKPQVILELGSGLSTIIVGLCLKRMGSGVVWSFEHDEAFAARTSVEVARHGLTDFVQIVHAPLKDVVLGGESYPWYDTGQLNAIASINLLIVDGPPGELRARARFPALPILWDKLALDATIVLDDTSRPDEQSIVELWSTQFSGLQAETVPSEKGAVILRRVETPR